MQLYAITGPAPGPVLIEQMKAWAAGGVHFIQLRRKELDADQLHTLAQEAAAAVAGTRSRLLINFPATLFAEGAFVRGAAGVHLAGRPVAGAVSHVRRLFPNQLISVPCHTLEEVAIAANEEVDAMLFSPVFEKIGSGNLPQGLEVLRRACAAAKGIPVFALGGVTLANAGQCIAAGAAGVAGIRLFAGDDWRGLAPS